MRIDHTGSHLDHLLRNNRWNADGFAGAERASGAHDIRLLAPVFGGAAVIFEHDSDAALLTCIALINTEHPPDALTTTEQLSVFVATNRLTGRVDLDDDELCAVQNLRPVLRRMMTSARAEAARIVNEMLAQAPTLPQLVRHDGADWHLHVVAGDQPLSTRLAAEAAMAMKDVIIADETSRIGVCAGNWCARLVIDLSRNRSRRFCSSTCSNRSAVAAHRARRQVH